MLTPKSSSSTKGVPAERVPANQTPPDHPPAEHPHWSLPPTYKGRRIASRFRCGLCKQRKSIKTFVFYSTYGGREVVYTGRCRPCFDKEREDLPWCATEKYCKECDETKQVINRTCNVCQETKRVDEFVSSHQCKQCYYRRRRQKRKLKLFSFNDIPNEHKRGIAQELKVPNQPKAKIYRKYRSLLGETGFPVKEDTFRRWITRGLFKPWEQDL